MKKVISISALAVFLCGGISIQGASGKNLDIPSAWKPSHPQNGKGISATVRVFGVSPKPFPDPKTGKQVFQSKVHILKRDAKTGEFVLSGVWAYLLSSAPFKKESVLRVSGELSVSEGQIKGGVHPATIRVKESKKEVSNKPVHENR